MTENQDSKGSVFDAMNAAANLAKEIPIYQDSLQPAAKEIGVALETVGRAVNVALAPLRGAVWGYEQFETWLATRVAEKLKNVDEDEIVTPDLSVAGPTIESLKYAGHKAVLSDLYASLLATSMRRDEAHNAHPGFVEIIRSLSPDEARILEYLKPNTPTAIFTFGVKSKDGGYQELISNVTALPFNARCEMPEKGSHYIDNLARLGLVGVNFTTWLTDEEYYDEIRQLGLMQKNLKLLEQGGLQPEFVRGIVRLSAMGEAFKGACMK